MPVKLNNSFWPKFITDQIPYSDDPRVLLEGNITGEPFSRAVSVFRFGTTFKSTESFRFPTTVEALSSLEFPSPPTVLDVGASDGITSLHTIQSIDFAKYFIADLNIEAFYQFRNGKCYFYDSDKNCILIVTKCFVIYSKTLQSIFPFNRIAEHFFSKSPPANRDLAKIELINPEVKKAEGNIEIVRHNIFDPWTKEKLDLVIAANLLNRSYFSDQQIQTAAKNLVNALNDGGILTVIDSRDYEKSTLFRVVNKKLLVEKEVKDGTEIKELILKTNIE